MTDPIRMDEWLAALEQLRGRHDNASGFSREDVQRVLGINERNAWTRVRSWYVGGLVEFAGFRQELDITGRNKRVPVYRLTATAMAATQKGNGRTRKGNKGGR